MVEAELSLVRFCVLNFFSVLIQSRPFQPISTILIKLVDALINSEAEPDKKMQERIKWIYENTNENVETHLSVVELAVFRNLDKGVNREIEIGDKTFHLAELYNILDEISKELSNMVIKIAVKYNLDMPLLSSGSKGNMQSFGFEEEKT
jgi:hypothetical protein